MSTTGSISRILIANRGEIARRIIRTSHRLGIETVAVFTDPDRDAPYVHEASFAYGLGAPERYLDPDAIIAAAKAAGADAVHPGYGFLSESADFARLTKEAGLTFIGPSAEAIARLGSKTKAKALALAANVPTAPTLLFTSTAVAEMATEVRALGTSVGYPLLIKAAAGGGGRGMRIITESSDVALEIQSAQREALKAFGSDEVFVERFLSPARHIEVQIAADQYGAAVALGTRDCSLQRNNQKIIEEAPAPSIAPDVEQRLLEAARSLACAAGYSNLGTVEFLYLADGSFYFLEVNTRLQVEHPITECVTGLDLVELQIALACGASLSSLGLSSPPPPPRGHAVEARWCAEELREGRFINATGTVLEVFIGQSSSPTTAVRSDMGIEPCSRVSHHYDSMVGKVIVHAPSRAEAVSALREVLMSSHLSGVATNRGLLVHLLGHPDFAACTHSVQGSAKLFPSPTAWSALQEDAHVVAAALRAVTPLSEWAKNSPWPASDLPNRSVYQTPFTTVGSDDVRLSSLTVRSDVQTSTRAEVAVTLNTITRIVAISDLAITNAGLQTATCKVGDAEPFSASILQDGSTLWVHLPHGTVTLTSSASVKRRAADHSSGYSVVKAHLPGKVTSLAARVGLRVTIGDVLAVLDSMKMEHPLRAPCDGTVVRVSVEQGAIVQAGTVLVEIEP